MCAISVPKLPDAQRSLAEKIPITRALCKSPAEVGGGDFGGLEPIQSGKLRALATTSSKRIPELPDLPTMAESGFAGFVSTSWTGLLAPAHTPRDVIDKLNVQINEGLKSAELRSALGKLSNQPLGGTPQDFTDMIKGDIGKWAPIVKALGLTAG
jgi:tripartite-type tricarboxylate transporter receptor subunit TctC